MISMLSFLAPQVSAGGFLVERPAGWEAKVQADAVRADLEMAMADALGHGHGVEHSRLLDIRKYLSILFDSLPARWRFVLGSTAVRDAAACRRGRGNGWCAR